MNSILIYSEALQLRAYYNIFDIQERSTNILSYKFPTENEYEAFSIGNPLRDIHTIILDDALIEKKNCKSASSYCLAAISLYPDLNI